MQKALVGLIREAGQKARQTVAYARAEAQRRHDDTMNRLFAAYARGKDAKELMVILGEAALTDIDKLYAKFADEFERR